MLIHYTEEFSKDELRGQFGYPSCERSFSLFMKKNVEKMSSCPFCKKELIIKILNKEQEIPRTKQ